MTHREPPMGKRMAPEPWGARSPGISDGPGVYIMRDAKGRALYVGKAKSLRSRLRNYRDTARLDPKTELLLARVRSLETIVTETELEALILENSLIKEHRPRYNITLRDDKTYPFLRLPVHEKYPALTVVRRPAEDGARYFGPFVPSGAMRRTVKILQRIFPLRRCSGPLKGRKARGCLNRQMKRCLGPCTGAVSEEEYGEMVRGVAIFLSGGGSKLAAEYRRRMKEHARRCEYEEAAVLRDRVAAIESTLSRQNVHLPGQGDRDAVGLAVAGSQAVVAVLESRRGRITDARTVSIQGKTGEEEILSEFLRAYYDGKQSVPGVILLPRAPGGAETLARWLGMKSGGRVTLTVPRSGPARALVTMASRTALERLRSRGTDRKRALEALGEEAAGGVEVSSLAAVDISSLSGTCTAASLVWWEDGRFVRKNYRRMRIGGVRGGDDYASMRELVDRVARKVMEGEWPEPDVLLLDGGRAHLSEVRRTLAATGWAPRLLLAIAKGRKNRKGDTVFCGRDGRALRLSENSLALRTLQAARDEAHRFAVSYHRTLRKRVATKSPLDGVPGIGPARKKLLLRTFGSLKRIKAAAKSDLLAVEGLPASVVEDLYDRLRRKR